MERSGSSYLFQYGLTFLLVTLIVGWLARSRRPAERQADAQVLIYSKAALIVGCFTAMAFAFFTVLIGSSEDPSQRPAALFFVVGLLFGASFIWEGVWVRHELSPEGLVYRGAYRRYAMIAWTEFESARWRDSMKWFVVTTRDGRKLRFSAMLNGLEAFAAALQAHCPDLEVDAKTAVVLADARHGVLPSIWA
jgi:hypothetical protein